MTTIDQVEFQRLEDLVRFKLSCCRTHADIERHRISLITPKMRWSAFLTVDLILIYFFVLPDPFHTHSDHVSPDSMAKPMSQAAQ